jgi:hypothetical protein
MAQLTAPQKAEVKAEIMQRWSGDRTSVPIDKSELDTLLTFIDESMEVAETEVITRIPGSHPARAWLIANGAVARRVMEMVEAKRREVL